MKQMIIYGVGGLVLIIVGSVVGTIIATTVVGGNTQQAVAEEAVEETPEPKEAIYEELRPSFVVNFGAKSSKRYMQLDLTAMSYEQEAIDALKHHMPLVRNNLLMLFGTQDSTLLGTREGKDQLRKEALAAVQTIMNDNYGKEGIEDLYFTKLVIQ